MATIYVKAKPGRVAYHEGRKISHDDFVPVPDSPYIRRLINHWEDLEVQGDAAQTARRQPPPPPRESN